MWCVSIVYCAVLLGCGCASANDFDGQMETEDVLTLLDQDMALLAAFRGALGDESQLSAGNWSKEVLLDSELHRMLVKYTLMELSPDAPPKYHLGSEICHVVGDARAVRKAMRYGVHEDTVIRRLPGDEFNSVMEACLNATVPPFYRYLTIFPGTNYCGAGNVAPRPGILGKKRDLDKCCYWHDTCHFSIPAGTRWKNITNGGVYTISACDCDEKFLQCLSSLGTLDSRIVRYVYFDWLRLPCIRLDYPILRCLNRDWFGRCIKYAFDFSAESKDWQVIPSPFIDRVKRLRSEFDSEETSSIDYYP